ncbi:MAG: hypothetical protein QM784_01550 [Polyangiaceae bacterium]
MVSSAQPPRSPKDWTSLGDDAGSQESPMARTACEHIKRPDQHVGGAGVLDGPQAEDVVRLAGTLAWVAGEAGCCKRQASQRCAHAGVDRLVGASAEVEQPAGLPRGDHCGEHHRKEDGAAYGYSFPHRRIVTHSSLFLQIGCGQASHFSLGQASSAPLTVEGENRPARGPR